ncbi:MAG: hypothetical protein P5681_07475 [Limnospira sp. PMC 894.15]|uniref:Uncharacterized protein n=1 Tax=Limnospira fusiformis PMC 851.14 TaxID=2219512 RepID=A0ABU9EMX8_LIMFS|nr:MULTISPECIES: hypothetical protein [unclassified Limnospira]MDT9187645.1 hypothetical protein [Limnospira sp. PMC 894.15]MDT9234764.1 hypothetical protein [Limnospira sp. PMC 917.15]MDT9275689.1 hypothetical protein [Limnospira sp. PMC 737.11]
MAKNRAVFKHKLPSGKYINTHRYHQLNSRQKRRINYRINYDPTVTGITWFLVGFLGFLAIYSAKIKIEKDVVSLVNSQSNKIDKKLQATKFQQISHRWLLGHSSGVHVPLNTLFADLNSLGALSICAAEGNCETNGRRTSLIAGHFDPATGILNKGFCSNHGRGGTLQEANQWCLQHLRSRSFVIEQQFREVGINPNSHLEGFINAIDLWNQSPYFGAKFPQLYASELRGRKKGTDAILSARVNSFKINGSYEQTTLAHPPICPYSIDAKSCVRHDQSRRMNAISGVMEHLGLK